MWGINEYEISCVFAILNFETMNYHLVIWHSELERSTMLLRTVNYLFLWAIYTMALLVITRWWCCNTWIYWQTMLPTSESKPSRHISSQTYSDMFGLFGILKSISCFLLFGFPSKDLACGTRLHSSLTSNAPGPAGCRLYGDVWGLANRGPCTLHGFPCDTLHR